MVKRIHLVKKREIEIEVDTSFLLDHISPSPKNLSYETIFLEQVLNIYELSPLEEDFVLGERGDRVGKVPR